MSISLPSCGTALTGTLAQSNVVHGDSIHIRTVRWQQLAGPRNRHNCLIARAHPKSTLACVVEIKLLRNRLHVTLRLRVTYVHALHACHETYWPTRLTNSKKHYSWPSPLGRCGHHIIAHTVTHAHDAGYTYVHRALLEPYAGRRSIELCVPECGRNWIVAWASVLNVIASEVI